MEPIAIVGIGCRFADAADPETFFDLLKRGIDATRETPEDRWSLRSFYDPDRRIPGKLSTNRGGYLPQIDGFDAQFFGISPREAAYMDPQQRLMLEVSWEAMEDAGLAPERLAGTDVGVFVGAFTLDYKAIQLGRLNRHLIDAHTATGAMMTMVSNRISYVFDFRGPSMSIDTACSSSLVAVHLACQSIRGGECSIALAGGVNVMVTPEYTIAESKGGFLAPDGRSKPFSASANGYGRAEGAGAVVLKPLAAAMAAGDPIYAVIRGSAVNQDGRTNGITVPSGAAQERLIHEACRRAGVSPGRIQYVEAHGTGTPVGDPIEIGALAAALGTDRPEGERCIVGSVKGNIGHLEAGAGAAGLIKAALCLKNRQIPPNLHFENPNPKIPFDELPVRVPTALESWPETTGPALAGVNSFGFGGTNAHVIIEEAPKPAAREDDAAEDRNPVLFPLSARSPQALKEMACRFRDFAASAEDRGASFADMYYSAAFRRSHHEHRLGVAAGSSGELATLLGAYVNDEPRAAVASGHASAGVRPKLAFVCTGMGPQWWAMGRRLFADEPVFRESILRCDEVFRKEADWSLLMEMMADESQSRMAETQVAQTANFAIQMALAALWKSWGIEPDAIVGHSVGEVSAAYLSGALSLEDAIRVSFHRSRLQQTTAGRGAMMAVGLAADEVRELLGLYGGRISVAAVNGPAATTVSGDPGAIQALGAKLTAAQVFNRPLRVDVAYHSAQMDPLEAELLDTLRTLSPRTATIPLYSTVTGDRVDGREFDTGYWWRNVREPVEFRKAMESLVRDGFDCFLEIGPHPVLASSIVDCVTATGGKAANYCSLRRGEDERTTMLSALGSLYSIGMPVRWEAFQCKSARFVRLPQYPWQRERYWSESEESLADRLGATPHPLLGYRLAAARPVWETEIGAHTLSYLSDHAVKGATVFPGAAYAEMALAAGREVFGSGDFAVERIQFERALFLPDGERPKVQTSVDAEGASFEIHSRTGAGGWARNAAGQLAQRSAQARTAIDQSEIAQRCAPPLDAEACYSRFAEQGFHYGPAFRKISRIAIGEGEALAWLDDLSMAGDEYQIHPTVLDACFQVLVATDPLRSAGGGQARTYLPVGVDKIEVTTRPEGSMWAWARLEHRDESGAKGSIWLCDAAGHVAVSIEGFEVKALDNVEGTLTQDQMQRSMYELRWSAQPAATVEDSPRQGGRWLVFADETGTAAAFAQALEATGAETIAVKAGTEYVYDGGRYTVNPSEPEHFKRLFEDAAVQSRTLAGVAHFWNLDLGQGIPNDERELAMAERKGALSVLHLAQALATSADTVPLWLVTRGAQAVKDGDSAAVMQAPVWGLGRVIGHQEHGSNWGGLIDLAPVQAEGEAGQLLAEMRARGDEDQIAFRDGERYVLRLERCANLKASLPARFRADATYLITGAFGALGALTARWMAERGARRLVLMGRSSLPERSRWNDPDLPAGAARRIELIRDLESKGAAVMIAAADAGDSAQVDAFVREFADAGWPAIRGVIHSAGLVQDQLMLQMDAASFLKVLRPKVHGAWNLHRALAAMPLDFFVLYSSIGSVVAATGQANYASANAFLDALAHHRKHLGLASTSINWGPWAAGMVADLNLAEYFATRGLETITPEHGMRFLGHAMAQRGAQMAVLSADWGRLFEFQPKVPVMLAHLASEEDGGASSKAENETDFLQQLLLAEEGEQSAVLEQHVQALAARVLRMDREKIDVAQPLSAFGLDSMMATELKNRLEMSLRIPVSVLDFLKGLSISEFSSGLLPRLFEENGEIRELLEELEAAGAA